MSVIVVTLGALALGVVLILFLSIASPDSRCAAIFSDMPDVEDDRHQENYYNVCILLKTHDEMHMTVDGRRF